ncbi:hypothetical protein KVR01_003595 [Diaporthe batatas]|uniref:uncharacterized protein n=1 Tax=Diaporthe batatas TaxID=748121 RepID=UPI001D04E12F|nr:uncharacterized protein KVR01_003595 [Diaporthe batatas]KAG8167906.1 hypothetical protein KVR01_003595 [Diaporthe batatas]
MSRSMRITSTLLDLTVLPPKAGSTKNPATPFLLEAKAAPRKTSSTTSLTVSRLFMEASELHPLGTGVVYLILPPKSSPTAPTRSVVTFFATFYRAEGPSAHAAKSSPLKASDTLSNLQQVFFAVKDKAQQLPHDIHLKANVSADRDLETEATAQPTGEATTYTQRSRITLPDYQDPRQMEGVSSDIVISASGKPRFRVDSSVWRRMSTKDKKEFSWRCNIYFGLRSGGEARQPTSQDRHSQGNVTLTTSSSTGPIPSNPGEVEAKANVPRAQLYLPEEAHNKLANVDSVTRNKKQNPVQSPAPNNNRMTASAPRQTSRVGTEPAFIRNPANESIANPTDRSSAGEIATGSAVWDNRCLLEWLSSPDWKPASPRACIFMFCGVKSTTEDALNAHILRDHYGAPPTGTIVDARGDFLNAAALESYFGGSIPPSAQVYVGRWFPHDCP